MIKGHELSTALNNLQCFNCGTVLREPNHCRDMQLSFKNSAIRADTGILKLTDNNKLKYLRQGKCWMCGPLKDLLRNEDLLF